MRSLLMYFIGLTVFIASAAAAESPLRTSMEAGAPHETAGSGREQWSHTGIASMAPQLSEALGSIRAGATLCDLAEEAQMVDERHREHVARLAEEMPAIDPVLLEEIYEETAASYLENPGHVCSAEQRREIRRSLPDVFASIEAFHAELATRR